MATKVVSQVIVIGGGIGGLTTAALLAQAGYNVNVLEAQTYPGGCASTWTHKGYRFESGATVAGGFQPNGPHSVVGEMLDIRWPVKRHDPAWVVHLPGAEVALSMDNADVLRAFPHTARFWETQARLANLTWRLAAQIMPWPPTSGHDLMRLAQIALRNFPDDLQALPYVFSTVYDWVERLGLAHDARFVRFLDGQLLISAQTTSKHVNALWGATALDLARQGVYHVRGGIGGLAQTLVDTLRRYGGEILYRHRASRFEVIDGRIVGVWVKRSRHSSEELFMPADFVVANTTPWDAARLLGDNAPARLQREITRARQGWGAFVLHLGVDADVFPPGYPDHHQILLDLDGPLGETRSIFMSISPEWDDSRAPEGKRAVTITTHTDPSQWWHELETDRDSYYAKKEDYSAKIIAAVDDILPGFRDGIALSLPGTPVTYQFYTDRHDGMVGGLPITSLFKVRGPRTGVPNLRLVGDSIFPGQSTAGVSLGAMRVAADVKRNLALHASRASVIAIRDSSPDSESTPESEP